MVPLTLAFIYVGTGTTFLAMKLVSHELSPVALTVVRLLVAALILAPITVWRLRTRGAWPTAPQLRGAALTGVLLFAIGQVGIAVGVASMSAGVGAVITSATPLFIAILSTVFLREPLPARQLLGVLLGFGGIAALTMTAPDGEIVLAGVAALLVAAFAWAIGSLYGRSAAMPSDAVVTLNVQLLVGALVASPLMALDGHGAAGLLQLSGTAWAGMAYLVAMAIAAFMAFNWLNLNVSSTIANTFNYVTPVIAMGLGAAFLGETVTAAKLASAAVALVGVVLILK
ncbi:DMT family transporter [Variovorax boronicumulans]|uniref:DMT family transporter n=1 Tax=Variovorax boronicumulans TaxID=436515 RepID=UPI001C581942